MIKLWTNRVNSIPFRCRFHQHLIANKAVDLFLEPKFLEQERPRLLLACVCRSGKTYILAGILQKLLLHDKERFKTWKILVITSRPTETRGAWESVFRCHQEFRALEHEVKVISRQLFSSKKSWDKIVSKITFCSCELLFLISFLSGNFCRNKKNTILLRLTKLTREAAPKPQRRLLMKLEKWLRKFTQLQSSLSPGRGSNLS